MRSGEYDWSWPKADAFASEPRVAQCMKRLLAYLVVPAVGLLIGVVAYQLGFPAMIFSAIVVFGYGLLFLLSEGDFIPLTAFIGYVLGLVIASGALVS